jgi:microcin C transport system substrate-binding protein
MAWNSPRTLAVLAAALLATFVAARVDAAEPAKLHTALSLVGKPKQPEGFKNFDWVNPDAPKGGRVRMSAVGTFDSFNAFSTQGVPGGRPDLTQATLMASASADEDSAIYGHIADWVSYPDDYASATFGLRKDARFSDGKPITVDDVIFSLTALKSAHPAYNSYYKHVLSAERTGDNEVTFRFDGTGNRELPVIVGGLWVLSKAYWTGTDESGNKRDITKSTLEPPVGAGPYRVKSFEAGRNIVLERVADWWAKDLPASKGLWNFDEIRVEYSRERTGAFEAFKAGNIDFWMENVAKEWATAYDFDAVKRGAVKLEKIPRAGLSPMQSFAFNIRRPQFQDVRVRKALSMVFNFEWANKNLFADQYVRVESFFGNSELQSKGLPQGRELEFLESVRAQVPPEVFTAEWKNVQYNSQDDDRRHLRAAARLLQEAGWTQKDGALVNAAGDKLTVEILLAQPTFERVVQNYTETLKKIGVNISVRVVDPSQYQRRVDTFDFDMVVHTFAQSLSPGNEQRGMWGSDAAGHQGSNNVIGIRNPAVDALVEKIIMAPNRDDLVAATRALDRVLLWNYYVIPQWTFPFERIAYWDKFKRPAQLPSRGAYFLQTWWLDQDAAKRLGAR